MGSTNRDQVLRIVLLTLTAASVCGAQQPASPAGDTVTAQPAPVAAAQVPADAPVMPPKVVCAGDQMTIAANNSTLSSVLAEVHRCMGTRVDIPDAAGSKRMFDHIGPGPASQVLDAFLSNTGYNYVIGASSANQEKIESIVLLARSADAGAIPTVEDNRANSPNRRAFMAMRQAAIPHPMTEADTAPAEVTTPADSSTAAPSEPVATPQPAGAEGQAPAADLSQKPADASPVQPEAPSSPAQPPSSTSGRPSTTQDQITNMQQMFELRKQMNQPQNQNPPRP